MANFNFTFVRNLTNWTVPSNITVDVGDTVTVIIDNNSGSYSMSSPIVKFLDTTSSGVFGVSTTEVDVNGGATISNGSQGSVVLNVTKAGNSDAIACSWNNTATNDSATATVTSNAASSTIIDYGVQLSEISGIFGHVISPNGTSGNGTQIKQGETARFTLSYAGTATSGSSTSAALPSAVWTNTSGVALDSAGQQVTREVRSDATTGQYSVTFFGSGSYPSRIFYYEVISSVDDLPTLPAFPDPTNQERNTEIESETRTISGMDTGASCTVSVNGTGKIRVNGGTLDATSKVVENGDFLSVSVQSSSSYNTGVSTTITFTGDTSGDLDTEVYTVTTKADPSGGEVIASSFVSPYSQREIMRFFGGDDSPSKYPIRPDNLRAYVRGGDHVPDTAANSGIGNVSNLPAAIRQSQFAGSDTRLLFETNPSNQNDVRFLSQVSGLQTCSVTWSANGAYTIGYSPGMWSNCDFQYSFTVTQGTPANVTANVSTGAWLSQSATLELEVDVPASTEAFYSGTVTIQARSQYDNSKIITATANWNMGVIDNVN